MVESSNNLEKLKRVLLEVLEIQIQRNVVIFLKIFDFFISIRNLGIFVTFDPNHNKSALKFEFSGLEIRLPSVIVFCRESLVISVLSSGFNKCVKLFTQRDSACTIVNKHYDLVVVIVIMNYRGVNPCVARPAWYNEIFPILKFGDCIENLLR